MPAPYHLFHVLAPTCWKLQKAVTIGNQGLTELGLLKHPAKTFIGKTEKGCDVLGYHFSPEGRWRSPRRRWSRSSHVRAGFMSKSGVGDTLPGLGRTSDGGNFWRGQHGDKTSRVEDDRARNNHTFRHVVLQALTPPLWAGSFTPRSA